MRQPSPNRWRKALLISLVAHSLSVCVWNSLPIRTANRASEVAAKKPLRDPFAIFDDEPGGVISLAPRPGAMTPRATFKSPFELTGEIVQVAAPPSALPIKPQEATPLAQPKPAPGEPGKLPPLDAIPLDADVGSGTQRTAGTAAAGAAPGGVSASRFFPVEEKSRRIVYVLDRSMSMGEHGAREAAFLELLKSLHHLPPTTRFQILVYNTMPTPVPPNRNGWLEPTRSQIDEIAQLVVTLQAEGRTDHAPALRLALSLQPDVIYFLTDADDLNIEHLRSVESWNQSKAVIHTVELTSRHRDRPEMPMQRLARMTGGVYRAVDLVAYWKEVRAP